MSQKVSLKTIAKDLNLSTGTVSRVINGKAKAFRISEETVKKVMDCVKERGYSPNLIAKGLRDSKTYTIGLMIPDIANPFFALMAKQIEKAASEASYSILLVDAEENLEKEKKQIVNLLGRKVDGVIAAPVGISFKHFNAFKENGTPLVFIDRYFKDSDITYISSDNFQGGYLAAEYFIKNGHKRLGLLKGDDVIEPVLERSKGYVKGMLDYGLAVNEQYFAGNEFTIKSGYENSLRLLRNNNPPTAILAMSNLIGLGVLQAAKELDLNIPNDISLIVFDDQPYVNYLNPPISTIKQNSERIGFVAIQCLLDKINDTNVVHDSINVPVSLIERESVLNLN